MGLNFCHFKMPGTIYVIAICNDRVRYFPGISRMASSGWLLLVVSGWVGWSKKLLPEGVKPLFRALYRRFIGEP